MYVIYTNIWFKYRIEKKECIANTGSQWGDPRGPLTVLLNCLDFFFFTINIVYGRRKWDVDLLEKPGRAFSLALIRWQTEAGVSCFPCRGDSDIHVYSWQELLVFWGRGFMMFFESYCSVMGLAPPVYSCVESHVLEKQERVNGVRDASVVPSEDKWVTCRFHSPYTIFITVKTEY